MKIIKIYKLNMKANIDGNTLLLKCVELLLDIINNQTKFYTFKEQDNSINIKSFDEDISFYRRIMNDFSSLSSVAKKKKNISENYKALPKIVIRNTYIYLNFIKSLIKINDKSNIALYKDKKIKLDIIILFGYFMNKHSKRIVYSPEYFFLSIKEVEKAYNFKCCISSTPFDENWKNKAKELIKELEKDIINQIELTFEFLYNYYNENNRFEELDQICSIKKSFEEDRLTKSIKDLEQKYILNSVYINEYLTVQIKQKGIMEDDSNFSSKKEEFQNYIFYSEILKIDLNNVENAMNILDFYSKKEGFNKEMNIDNEFQEYQNNIKLVINEEFQKGDYTKLLQQILGQKEFHQKLREILESKSVKDYLENKQNFINGDFDVQFVNDNCICDDYIKKGYNEFINSFKNDITYLKDLIIIKFLPKNIRAFVCPYMRIALNPLFIEISDLLKQDENALHEIIMAYLIIVLVHEVVYLSKFFNTNEQTLSINNSPSTQKNREGGLTFINYLFGIPIINSINIEQSKKINDEKNWDNIDILKKIFEKENKIKNDEEAKVKSKFFIKFYDTNFENEMEDNELDNDSWLDID